MEQPKVSVITICRNAASELERTVRSVVAQEGVSMEFIIVDGASTDGTPDVIRQTEATCRQRNMPLRWMSEPDGGIFDAMNKGVRMASGQWLSFMNAGDLFSAPDVLARLMVLPSLSETDVVYGSVRQVFDFGTVEMPPAPLSRLEKKMAFCHQACLVRADVLRAHPYDLRYPLAADYELMHWCYTQGKRFVQAGFPVADFESEQGTSSRNRLRLNREFAHISGRFHTWGWRFEYLGRVLEVGFNKLTRAILPRRSVDQARRRNYRRIQNKR